MRDLFAKYILEGKKPVPETDPLKWGYWMESTENRRLAFSLVRRIRKTEVSTVFLGLDHNFSMNPNEEPLLFETMIFQSGALDNEMIRTATWDEALEAHKLMVKKARRSFRWI